MTAVRGTLFGFLERFAARLRFPQLFWLTAILFVLDVFIPDMIPFADEILLGLATLLLGSWKRNRDADQGKTGRDDGSPKAPVIDVPPEP
jgi:hypothetical protein